MTADRVLRMPTGEVLTIRRTGSDTGGADFEVDATLPPGLAGPPAHRHRTETETFTVLDGTLRVRVGDRIRDLETGESVVVPPHTVHAFSNPSSGPTRIRMRETPAGPLEAQLRALAAAGGLPPLSVLARINVQHDLSFALHRIPDVVQRPMWRALAALPAPRTAVEPRGVGVEHTVELSAGTIRYEDTGGDGPVLVFLHGLLMDGSLWRHVVPELRPRYRCVLPTLPLGGHSTPMRPQADLSLAAMADLIGELLDRLDLREVTLVQNDWGGAQILVARGGAERVTRLVLTSCEAFDNYPPSIARPIVPLAKLPGGLWMLMRLLRLRTVRRAPGGWGWMSKRPVPEEVMTRWFRPATTDPAVRRDLAAYVTSVPSRRVLLGWAEDAATFPGPVLVAWAAEDRTMPLEHGQRLAAMFADSELVEIPDSYTLIPEDQPHAFARRLRAFLARTDPVSAGG